MARVKGPLAALVACALLAVGCGEDDGAPGAPREGRAGLHVTGTLDGQQLAVSDSTPRLFVGDCEPQVGPSEDVCFISQNLVGETFVFIIKNPAALVAGASLAVAAPPCPTPAACDEMTDVAIIDIQTGTDRRQRAVDGTLTMRRVEVGSHYVGAFTLRLPGGRLAGEFDVVPRRD